MGQQQSPQPSRQENKFNPVADKQAKDKDDQPKKGGNQMPGGREDQSHADYQPQKQ